MASKPPRIAINCDYDAGEPGAKLRRRATVYMPYVEAVLEAGGLPLLVPPSPREALEAYLELADGVLFTGGLDYPTELYGEKPGSEVHAMSAQRADSDRALMTLALGSSKPALGICAGLQLLNISAGGALIQHLPNAEKHRAEHPEKDRGHNVRLMPGTQIREIFGAEAIQVNSAHHQAADPKRLAPGLKVSALAEDSTIEGLELEQPDGRFFVFVQWHPERIPDAAHRKKLFSAFVSACR